MSERSLFTASLVALMVSWAISTAFLCNANPSHNDDSETVTALPGEELTREEAHFLRGAATIHGDCVNQTACSGSGIACKLSWGGGGCEDSTSGCGSCTGPVNQKCISNPESPYLCETNLPVQVCCTVNKLCRWGRLADGSPYCNCVVVSGASAAVGQRTVC